MHAFGQSIVFGSDRVAAAEAAERRTEMAGKSDMRFNSSGRRPDGELAEALLAVLGVGVAGGIALLGGAMKLGEKVMDLQVKAYERIEAEREARREAVRQIAETEIGFGEDPEE